MTMKNRMISSTCNQTSIDRGSHRKEAIDKITNNTKIAINLKIINDREVDRDRTMTSTIQGCNQMIIIMLVKTRTVVSTMPPTILTIIITSQPRDSKEVVDITISGNSMIDRDQVTMVLIDSKTSTVLNISIKIIGIIHKWK